MICGPTCATRATPTWTTSPSRSPTMGRGSGTAPSSRAGNAGDFARALEALELGTPVPNLTEGYAERAEGAVFVFGPHGGEWAGMGRELLDTSGVFRRHIHDCAEALEPFVEWSLIDVLRGAVGAPGFDRADVAQPAILAISIALAELLRAHGVEPVAILGHSIGDVPAAYMAGALSLDDAARVMALWSLSLETLRDRGGMASVELTPEALEPYLARWSRHLNVAAHNGPGVTVVSGDSEALEALLEELRADGVRAQRASVPLAGHSPHIDAVYERILADLAPVAPLPGRLPFYSSAVGGLVDPATLGPAFWPRALREVAEFERATRAVLAAGHRVLIEIGPHPVLTLAMRQTVDAAGAGGVVLSSMRRRAGRPRADRGLRRRGLGPWRRRRLGRCAARRPTAADRAAPRRRRGGCRAGDPARARARCPGERARRPGGRDRARPRRGRARPGDDRRGGARAPVQGARRRLGQRGRAGGAAQPAVRDPAGADGGVRPSHRGGAGRAGRGRGARRDAGRRAGARPAGGGRGPGRADRDRRDRLPLPRRGRLGRGPVAAAGGASATRSAPSRRTAAGTSTASPIPTRSVPAPAPSGRAASSTTRRSSTPRSSGSRRARRSAWTRSSGCCCGSRGRRWKTRASTRSPCAAATPGCSPACSGRSTARACTRRTSPPATR